MTAEPRYFGPAERPLFGWLHRPSSAGSPRATGIVICNPFGYEALCAHRSLRHFAEAAAALGYPSLRFDYDGTGDSAGDDLDAGRWQAWQASVEYAIDELRRSSGVTDVCLLGVRLGATIAALAAAGRGDVTGFVAIAPVVNGRAWLREIRALQAAMGRAEPPPEFALPEGVSESVGLLIGPETRNAISAIDLVASDRAPAKACLILDREDRPPSESWCNRLIALGGEVEHWMAPGFVEMMLDPHDAKVPGLTITIFTDWLAAHFPATAVARWPPAASLPSLTLALGDEIQESAHLLDGPHPLFAVVTSPVQSPPTRALLLLNAGANHHVGNGRMYVRFARRFAREGWLVVRYDVSGIGDSAPWPGIRENDVYTSNAVGDLARVIAFVRARPEIRRVEVAGLCSGAYHGFKGAASGLALDGVTVVNPLVFYWKPGMSLAYPPFQMVQAAAQYRRSALQGAKWKKLARGEVNILPIIRVFARRLIDVLESLAANIGRAAGLAPRDDLGGDIQRIIGRGTKLRFVFSAGDPGEALLRAGAGWVLPRLEHSGRVPISFLPGCDHSLSLAWMHEALWQVLSSALEEA